tara:strand:+ start:17372 stop:18076 length:705 start_codon:yes stop_codon:yes gene_type:complete
MKNPPLGRVSSNKDRIVEVALDLFNAHGVSAISTNEIASAAGVSPGNLYYHFANKHEIVRTLLPRIDAAIAVCFDYDEDPPLTTARMVKDYVDGVALLWDFRFFFGGLNDLVRNDAEIARYYAALAETSHASMVRFYVKLIRDGQMRLPGPRARIDDLARKTVLIWFNIVSNLQAQRSGAPITRADIVDGGLLCFLDVEPYLDADFARPVRRKLEALRREAEEAPTPRRAGARA